MPKIKQIGYMPAYGLNSGLGFTKEFPIKISVSFDNVTFDPDADFKVLVQCEPPKLYVDFVRYVSETWKNFDIILTYDDRILEYPNSKLFVPVGCWVDDIEIDKKDQITYLMSSKILSSEHRMRFMIMSRYQHKKHIGPFEFLMHRTPPRLPSKEPFLKNAKFQIVCENQVMTNMFTEKLIDCFRTKTVPIYYGCTNIEKFFNPRGIIQFNKIEELEQILNSLQPKQYDEMLPHITENYMRASSYWEKNVFERIEDEVTGFLQSFAIEQTILYD